MRMTEEWRRQIEEELKHRQLTTALYCREHKLNLSEVLHVLAGRRGFSAAKLNQLFGPLGLEMTEEAIMKVRNRTGEE